MFRSSPPEVFSKKDAVANHRRTTAQKRNLNKAALQHY